MNRHEFCTRSERAPSACRVCRWARWTGRVPLLSRVGAAPASQPGTTVKPLSFFDYRRVDPGDLWWAGPDGESIPVAGPTACPWSKRSSPTPRTSRRVCTSWRGRR